jgi:hypothetical protein
MACCWYGQTWPNQQTNQTLQGLATANDLLLVWSQLVKEADQHRLCRHGACQRFLTTACGVHKSILLCWADTLSYSPALGEVHGNACVLVDLMLFCCRHFGGHALMLPLCFGCCCRRSLGRHHQGRCVCTAAASLSCAVMR